MVVPLALGFLPASPFSGGSIGDEGKEPNAASSGSTQDPKEGLAIFFLSRFAYLRRFE